MASFTKSSAGQTNVSVEANRFTNPVSAGYRDKEGSEVVCA